jgi:predicted nucleotidyltransferase
MAPEPARAFVGKCRERFPDRVQAVILVGSFARGAQRPKSDIDLIVLVDRVDNGLLREVSKVVASVSTANELNPALVATSELLRDPDIFDWLPIKHDGVVLLGELPQVSSCRMSELDLAKLIAHDVLMSSRHYLAVAEPPEKFAGGKLWVWNQKPLAFAVRFYEYHKTGQYTRSFREISQRYPVLARDPVTEHVVILEECIEICEEILRA